MVREDFRYWLFSSFAKRNFTPFVLHIFGFTCGIAMLCGHSTKRTVPLETHTPRKLSRDSRKHPGRHFGFSFELRKPGSKVKIPAVVTLFHIQVKNRNPIKCRPVWNIVTKCVLAIAFMVRKLRCTWEVWTNEWTRSCFGSCFFKWELMDVVHSSSDLLFPFLCQRIKF